LETHEASDIGRIRHNKHKNLVSSKPNDSGYCTCGISGKQYFFHTLIGRTFLENPSNKPYKYY
jgi:hypothetical protein